MRSALVKDLAREIGKSWSRFFSIFAIVLIGVAFFAGIKATAPDMKHTADHYYDAYNMMDIRVLSTLGLTEEDVAAIRAIDTIEQASPGYFTDAVSIIRSTEYVFRLHSLPESSRGNPINGVKIVEGRYPEKSGECLLESSKNINLGLKIGDKLHMGSGKDTPITREILHVDEFTIVGTAETPYYLSYEKGSSDIGNGKVSFFLMIPEEDFAYPVYTETLITVRGAREVNSYSAAYHSLVSKTVVALENIGIDRSGIRLGEIKQTARERLDAAKKEYDTKKQEFDDKMKTSEAGLSEAQTKLNKAEATLVSEKANFKITTQQAKEQISQGKADLAQGEKEYKEGLKQYNQARAEYGDTMKTLDDTVNSINEQRARANEQIALQEKQLENPDLTDEERQQTTSLINQYRDFLSLTDEAIASANDLNNFTKNQLNASGKKLKQARKDLDAGYSKINAAEAELKNGEIAANAKFAQAEEDIAAGWLEYDKGKQEYEQGKVKGDAELAAAREKIIRAENDIERISQPQWYVLDRNSHFSFADYGMTADQIDGIAKVFPVFFFLVAALVCLTTMTRMVDEQRGNIGTYKALGYSNADIAVKYVAYAAIASVLGAAAGLAIGMSVFPEVIYQSWSMKYTLPPLEAVQQVPLMILSLCMGILVTTLTALYACYKELKETPSLLMRPKSPKAGGKILLERAAFLWRRFTFSQKVTARNIFRYKKRFFMTIIGISGCTALLLAGFGLSNSISQVVNKQYKEIFTYDLNMRYSADSTGESRQHVMDALSANQKVNSFITGTELNARVKSTREDIAVTLLVPSDTEKFRQYVNLRNSTSRQPLLLGNSGVVITEKLASELSAGVGDAIELDNGDGARKKVEITGITENYVFHYVYMSADYYKEIFRLEPEINSLMIQLHDTSAEAEDALAASLIARDCVASVTFYSAVAVQFQDTVKSLNSIVLVIIMCAGLLAFVVLYNLTNINISERVREIATIKVLGFYNREVSAYVFRENVFLTMLGALLGLLLGIMLHRYIMVSIEQEGIMFGNFIAGLSFVYSFIITMVFTGLVILFMGRRLKSIPMVESLKSVE